MIEIFRLCREKYANDLSGIGASLKGGRWNSPGVEMIYTAANRSLAMAEVAVHFTIGTVPRDYVMTTLLIPSSISIQTLDEKILQVGWNSFPYSKSTQMVGDRFITNEKSCMFKVPSAVTKGDFNFLINPHQKEMKKIKIKSIEKFPFDRRILK